MIILSSSFDKGARIAGLGENGAEAIVPLENNTQWIAKVARELVKQLNAVNNAYAAYSGQNVDGMSGATEQASSTDTKTTDCGNEPNSAACGTCNLHKNN